MRPEGSCGGTLGRWLFLRHREEARAKSNNASSWGYAGCWVMLFNSSRRTPLSTQLGKIRTRSNSEKKYACNDLISLEFLVLHWING